MNSAVWGLTTRCFGFGFYFVLLTEAHSYPRGYVDLGGKDMVGLGQHEGEMIQTESQQAGAGVGRDNSHPHWKREGQGPHLVPGAVCVCQGFTCR